MNISPETKEKLKIPAIIVAIMFILLIINIVFDSVEY